ncbi:MAG: hypothetical protein IKT77_01245, partial [Paludibacteraceae bacterium]|nr:hypothetical protein [Paludibacteraceae bacterium]
YFLSLTELSFSPTDNTDNSDFSFSLFRCAVAAQGALQMNTDFLSLRSINRQHFFAALKDFFCARHSLSKLNYALPYRKKSTVDGLDIPDILDRVAILGFF